MDGRSSLPSQRSKRVHFSYDEPDDDDAPRQKRPRFPKGKKESQGELPERALELVDGEEGVGPIKSTDPRLAAKERSVRRNQLTEQLLNSEDTSLPNDVLGAEEEYEGSDEEEEDGVKMEPFNLKQEREEGYFDAEGNYVEYRNDNEIKDAWLDSAEVDTGLAEKHMKRFAEEEVELDLATTELAGIMRRISDALQPGETVLQALRRLKETSTERDRRAKTKMSGQTKAVFDSLTEDAMKLLDNGDYNVYNEKKETFQREAEGYESLVKARLDLPNLGKHGGESSRLHEDMFSNDGDDSLSFVANLPDGTATKIGTMSAEMVGDTIIGSKNNGQSRDVGHTSRDMFADDEDEAVGTDIRNDSTSASDENLGGDPNYVYDESSGYYYNSVSGYYYDPNSGLFCSAASGQWFKFDEESNAYLEVVGEQAGEVEH